jgi:putative transposase
MIDAAHAVPITHQAKLPELSRASVYYLPRSTPASDLALMRRIDELHLNHPFAGSRMLRDLLGGEAYSVGCRHMARLMNTMDIEALYRRPHTSHRHAAHPIYPYLLRNRVVERPNEVWAMDITYIPMKRGFVYLAVVLDWATRRVLAWRLSISMNTDFCVDAVEEALAKYGPPEIFNTDRPGAANSRAPSSPACSNKTASPSAWTARVRGATTCSSNGCGRRSSTRRSTCTPMTASPRREMAWLATSTLQSSPAAPRA